MTGSVKCWAVADGREALGIVRLDDSGKFVAVDVAGRALGKFATLLEASRAFKGLAKQKSTTPSKEVRPQ